MAWEKAYSDFEHILAEQKGHTVAYIVFGVQGAGKSTWISQHKPEQSSIYFDAALPAKKHRIRVLSIARKYSAHVVAVWIKTSLEQAMTQNKQRKDDEIVPEQAVHSVFEQLEAPEPSEGFDEILIVEKSPGQKLI